MSSARAVFGEAALVAGGRIALLALWFVALTLSYRALSAEPDGVAQAGVISLSLALVKIVVTTFSDPLDMEVVRRVPTLPALAGARVWLASLRLRGALAMAVIAAMTLGGATIAHLALHDARWDGAVALAGCAAAGELLFRGQLADFQSRMLFGRYLGLELALQTLRITGLVGLFIWGALSAEGFLAVYAVAPALAALGGWLLGAGAARRRLLTPVADEIGAALRYARWIVPAMALGAMVDRMDLVMLGWLRGAGEAGLYGGLTPLLLAPEAAAGFMLAALQPRIAAMTDPAALRRFWKTLTWITAPLALAGIVFAWTLPETILAWSVGPAFQEAAPALSLALTAVMVWIGLALAPLAIVVMRLPRATLAICAVQAVTMLLATTALIPPLGAQGAALALLTMRATTTALLSLAALALLRRAGALSAAPT